ncbi:MAG: signal peptidase II, partial [Chitinophagales bacterium]
VVDMFYFPMFKGYYPEWFPIIGGKYFVFFRPVFNIADSAITIGVFSILIFQRGVFMHRQASTIADTEHDNEAS